jgi:uncharacterized protein YbjT (DUF2867 family)
MGPILVTGGTGHLGRDLVSLLKADGHRVHVLARTPGRDPAIEWVQGDLGTGRGVAEAVAGVQTHRPRGDLLADGEAWQSAAGRLLPDPN